MSRESFTRGFCKVAADNGIDPAWLYGFMKKAYPGYFGDGSQTVGANNPPQTVANVLSAIDAARVFGIGKPQERRDAFGRIINSGLTSTTPAGNALRMLGGGILGRTLTSAFTTNKFLKGLGTGIGAVSAISRY